MPSLPTPSLTLHNVVRFLQIHLTLWRYTEKRPSKRLYSLKFTQHLHAARPSACQILRQRSFHAVSRVQQVPPGTNQKRIRNAMPFFDADRFARLLEREGFSSGQARAVINSLDDVVDERYY